MPEFQLNCPKCSETAKVVFKADRNVWVADGCLMENSVDVSDSPNAGTHTIIRAMKPKCRHCGYVLGTENASDIGE